MCQGVDVVIQDHKFFGDLTVLPSNSIDVILGVDWITSHKGVISTSPRFVTLVHSDGTRVTFEPMKSRDIPAVYSLHTKAISDVPVVCEFEDVFPEELLLTVYFGAPSMFITLWFGFDYGTNPPLGTLII
jgi:hypothetical protein